MGQYFPGLFPQHYPASVTGGVMNFATSGTVSTLQTATGGTIALLLTDQNGMVTGPISSGTTQNVTLAMSSWHTIDQIGPNYQGLQVPQYSKTIQWNQVQKFEKRIGQSLQNQIVSIGWDQTTSGATSTVGPVFYCATSYELKVEVLGDAALAALNKQLYNNIQAWGGCCSTGCSSGCTSTAVDAAYIMLQWKDRINQNPLMTPFVLPQVFISSGGVKTEVFDAYDNSLNSALPIYVPNTANPTSVIASLQLTIAYIGTTYGDCTFTPRDRFEYSPLWIHASLVSQSPDPCAWNTTINTSVPNMFTEIQVPKPAIGTGDFIRRDYIMSQRYRQQQFNDSLYSTDIMRMREIENDTSALAIPSRSAVYDQIILIFNTVRRDNPTAVHSNDRYMICIDVPTGTNTNSLTNIISASLAAAGSSVVLQTF